MRLLEYSLSCLLIILFFSAVSLGNNFANQPVQSQPSVKPHSSPSSALLSFQVSNVDISLSVKHPAQLSLGEVVKVTVNYTTNISGDIRVLLEPMTNGSPSPGYSPHQSKNYDAKSGKAEGHFTISQDNVTVDQIQVSLLTAKNIMLHKESVPVQLHFSNSPIKSVPSKQIAGRKNSTQSLNNTQVVKRSILILPDGNIEITSSDDTKTIFDKDGHERSIILPDGTKLTPKIQTPDGATAPKLPDQESNLNATDLMNILEILIEKNQQSLSNYLQVENETTSNLYEKMQLRTKYIKILL